MRAPVLLDHSFFQDILHIMLFQRLFEPLFSGGVDPLADNDRFPVKDYCLSIRRDDGIFFLGRQMNLPSVRHLCHRTDMCRSCSAASADHTGAQFQYLLHRVREFFRAHIIIDLFVPLFWQSGVWFYDNRYGYVFHDLFKDREHLPGTHAAIDPKCVHPESLQHGDH